MDIYHDFVQASRLALSGRNDELNLLVRRTLSKIKTERPEFAEEIETLLSRPGSRLTRARTIKEANPLPIDADSRLELLRRDDHPTLPVTPTWPEPVLKSLKQFISERQQENQLMERGILPTRSLLFIGPPGVGKSLAASFLAAELKRPLLTLDLAAVMSSFLGRTGSNIRAVLDYARRLHSILLLDEFDAIAKRRDDSADVGELKRLVTVLLQSIDDWPSDGILIATTNHPNLLDPAVWRRFERVIEFPLPTVTEISSTIREALQEDGLVVPEEIVEILASLLEKESFADVRKVALRARRESFVKRADINDVIQDSIGELLESKSHAEKIAVAVSLRQLGWPERQISLVTGIARDTIRRKVEKAKQVRG